MPRIIPDFSAQMQFAVSDVCNVSVTVFEVSPVLYYITDAFYLTQCNCQLEVWPLITIND